MESSAGRSRIVNKARTWHKHGKRAAVFEVALRQNQERPTRPSASMVGSLAVLFGRREGTR